MNKLFSPLNLDKTFSSDNKLHLAWVAFFDVCLLAIGIFMLSSKTICPPGISVDLPKLKELSKISTSYSNVMTITENGSVYFDRSFYSTENLVDILKSNNKGNGTLLLKVDKCVSIENLTKILTQIKKAGVKEVIIASEEQI